MTPSKHKKKAFVVSIFAFIGDLLRPKNFALLVSFALTVGSCKVWATLIPVKHREGTSHGFIVLRSQEGRTLASGDVIQTVEGERVTSEVVLHFTDGSIHDETTVFSQKSDFRLIAYHLRQQGPTFPKPVDVHIDVAKGDVEISMDKDGEHKTEQHHLQIPEDASNGLTLTLLKNVSPSASETTISTITTSSKPKVVKLKIHAEGEQQFSASGERVEAIHYVIHTDIGAVAGAIASVRGKRPPDNHVWIVGGKAPVFIKFTGQLYDEGPMWNVELASVKWENKGSESDKH